MYHHGFTPRTGKRVRGTGGEGQRMRKQGKHENSAEGMVKWTFGH